jgi:hypothetical protein
VIAYADGDGRRVINLVEQLAVAAHTAKRSAVDLPFVEANDRALDAPLRQGRRGVLRPDLGAAQGGARFGPGCVALLDVPHARRRRRSDLRRPPDDPHGRPRTSASPIRGRWRWHWMP